MEDESRWYFTKEQLENTPSRKCGIEASKELSYRQQAANFIQDMGQRLQVTQLCINTAIVYMHRFFMFHSFTKIHRNQLAVAALFLGAKVEEQPRKLEHVVRIAHKCLHRGEDLDPKSDAFMAKCSDLVFNENVMLQTLGFEIDIQHPHTYVVKLLQLVKASKDLAQTSYFMATNSLHLTTMCLQYKPTVVACVCIHLACKWSNWKIEPCSEGKEWYYYVDKLVTPELLEELTKDFLAVLEKSPNRLKRRAGPENSKDGQATLTAKNIEEIVGRVEVFPPYENNLDSIHEKREIMSPLPPASIMSPSPPLPPVSIMSPSPPASGSLAIVKEDKPSLKEVRLLVKNDKSSTKEDKPLVKEKPSSKDEKPFVREEKPLIKQEKIVMKEEKLVEASINLVTEPTAHNFSIAKVKSEVPHSISLEVYREKREKERLLEQKMSSCAAAHSELPSVTAPVKTSVGERPNVLSQEKRHVKPIVTSSEIVPQKTSEKVSSKHVAQVLAETTSRDKVNHQVTKLPTSATLPTKNAVVRKNDLKPPHVRSDPFVLLTRVDQASISRKSIIDSKGNPQGVVLSKNLKIAVSSSLDGKHTSEPCLKTKPPMPNASHSKPATKSVEPLSQGKHQKQKAVTSVRSSQAELPPTVSQESVEKANLSWDSAKANGSVNVTETPTHEHRLHTATADHKTVEKNNEAHNRHDRREKHRHKHSVHSNKEKTGNHVPEISPSETNSLGSIKITIPKEKLNLTIHPDGTLNSSKGESPRTSLKIKIAKPKLPLPPPADTPPGGVKPNPSGTSLKLVFTKDKNAGCYSASHKAERSSRKRQRSPTSKSRNSSTDIPEKISKTNRAEHVKVHVDSVPVKKEGQNCNITQRIESYNQANSKLSSVDAYHQNSINITQQPYMMPYNTSGYRPQTYLSYMPQSNTQYGHMQPPPMPPPHMAKVPPPLPRDPPPPLPPQPPLPSE